MLTPNQSWRCIPDCMQESMELGHGPLLSAAGLRLSCTSDALALHDDFVDDDFVDVDDDDVKLAEAGLARAYERGAEGGGALDRESVREFCQKCSCIEKCILSCRNDPESRTRAEEAKRGRGPRTLQPHQLGPDQLLVHLRKCSFAVFVQFSPGGNCCTFSWHWSSQRPGWPISRIRIR